MSHYTTWTISTEEKEIEYDVKYTISGGSRGKTSGPPEDCEEPEAPEIEVIAIEKDGKAVPEDKWKEHGFTESVLEEINNRIYANPPEVPEREYEPDDN